MLDLDYKSELKKAIADLYSVFKDYRLDSHVEGCPCCVTKNDKQLIEAKVLTELSPDDLNRFAFKAMTTWGTVEDFKHFLPRQRELLYQGLSANKLI